MAGALIQSWRDRPLISKGRIVVAMPLLALAVATVLFLGAVRAMSHANAVVDDADQTQAAVGRVFSALVDAETGVRGFLLTDAASFLQPYEDATRALPKLRSELLELVRDDPELREHADQLSPLIDRRLLILREALGATDARLIAVLAAGKATMDEIRGHVSVIDRLLSARLSEARRSERTAVALAVWSAALAILLGVLAGMLGMRAFVDGIARGVQAMSDNAERLAVGSPLHEVPEGGDEIGRAGRALVAASDRLAERDRTIRENADLLALILQRIGDGVVMADPDGTFVVFNEAAERIFGRGALERDPSQWSATYGILSPSGAPFPAEDLPLARALRGESVDGMELLVQNEQRPEGILISVSGRPLLDEDGLSLGGVVVIRDVTLERDRERRLEANRIELERLNEELHAMAIVDALTELPNRRGFDQLSDRLVSLAERRAEDISVVFGDLDGLKSANDQLGHDVGSRMLVDAADAIRAVVRGSDVAARIGGDEFCILVVGGAESGERLMARLREHVARFNATSKRPYPLSLSLGCATSTPADRLSLDELMRTADARMYADKRKRRGQRVITPRP